MTITAKALTEFPELAAKATEFLSVGSANLVWKREEAQCIIPLMRTVYYPAGALVMKAGDASNSGYMLLILEGDVAVDTGKPQGTAKVDISVIGPGALIGELALLDGAPRSATCTAMSAVTAAGLSVAGLQRLLEQHPRVAAKLLIHIGQSAADRLRSLSEQLEMYDHITTTMQHEIDKLRLSVR